MKTISFEDVTKSLRNEIDGYVRLSIEYHEKGLPGMAAGMLERAQTVEHVLKRLQWIFLDDSKESA